MGIITLTTDFGVRDWFVGTMKGVILGIAPKTQVVDITHEVPPGDVQAGAFALASSYRFFPPGTVHLAVVDPGVGSKRPAITVVTRNYYFVGPDNGVLSLALAREKVKTIRRLENEKLFLNQVSRTFHGRDIFAPVAAHLSKGAKLAEVGPEMAEYKSLEIPRPEVLPSDGRGCPNVQVRGAIVYIDRFGNAITNLPETLPVFRDGGPARARVGKRRWRVPCCDHYQAVPPGRPLAVIGSTGFLEIAINGGNAAERFGLKVGDPVSVEA